MAHDSDKNNNISLDDLSEGGTYLGVGSEFEVKRISLDKSIERVAEEIRISPKYIEAIEAGEFSLLPGPTYVLGFLRTYSKYLGIDEFEVIKKYKIETSDTIFENTLEFPSSNDKASLPTKTIIFVRL